MDLRGGTWSMMVATLAGCGSVSGGAVDAATSKFDATAPAATIDADLRPCDPAKPFADVKPIAGLDTADDEGNPSLSQDELTVYFFSNRQSKGTPDFDAYVATRPTLADPFGAAAPITAINTQSDERGGSVSTDGLNLFLHSSRNSNYDLYVSTRANGAAAFGEPVSLGTGVNSADIEEDPFISADGKSLYFIRLASGGTSAIYRAISGPTGFANPQQVTELDDQTATRPVLSADERTIFFSSDRPGGAGSTDIWVATRTSASGTFGTPTNVAELNAGDFEFPDWVSTDGCRIYFTSRRAGGAGGWDMWQATRPH